MAKKKSTKIPISYESVENIYTDLIEIRIRDDAAILVLATKDEDGKTGKASHKVYMTLSHFVRFADVCNQGVENVKDQIKKANKPNKKPKKKS